MNHEVFNTRMYVVQILSQEMFQLYNFSQVATYFLHDHNLILKDEMPKLRKYLVNLVT